MSAAYELRVVQQAYDGSPRRVVLDVDALAVPAGQILAVVGPSGAGKSTLLRLLNFLEPPSAGTVVFDGAVVPPNPPLNLVRRVTTVFQQPVMLTGSVWDNVAYGLRLRGLPAEPAVSQVLERVGLAALARHSAAKLSGGEMQRTALARALVLAPDVLLLDEATANLDPYNVGLIESIVRDQNRTRGTTVVLVTHNVFQARRLATQAAFLLGGRLVEAGPVGDFFTRPRDPRTAAFVRGEMVY